MMPSTSRSTTTRSVIFSTTPLFPGDLDHVADGELILEQDEEAGDDILDQTLSAEGDRQAEDAGAGEDRPDIDEDVEGEQQGDGDMTTRPTLRSSWAMVWPRRSRSW